MIATPPGQAGAPRIWTRSLLAFIAFSILAVPLLFIANASRLFIALDHGPGESRELLISNGCICFLHQFSDPRFPTGAAGMSLQAGSDTETDWLRGDIYQDIFEDGSSFQVGGITYTPKVRGLAISFVPAIYVIGGLVMAGYLRNWTRWYLWNNGRRFPIEPLKPSIPPPPPAPPAGTGSADPRNPPG